MLGKRLAVLVGESILWGLQNAIQTKVYKTSVIKEIGVVFPFK